MGASMVGFFLYAFGFALMIAPRGGNTKFSHHTWASGSSSGSSGLR
jgi:hypothetical protein